MQEAAVRFKPTVLKPKIDFGLANKSQKMTFVPIRKQKLILISLFYGLYILNLGFGIVMV